MLFVSLIVPFEIYMFACEKNISPSISVMTKTRSAYKETGPNFWNLDSKGNKIDNQLEDSNNHINDEKESIHMK